MNEITIRMGGVPEHFNLPVHLARESEQFESRGVHVEWTDYPGGTGQMTRALREDEVDVCILLTEGIIADIVRGNPSKIISEYVITPLNWGIHTGKENPLGHHEDIYNKRYAISRFGSGSHLMAIVDATHNGHQLREEQFHVVNNLEGALQSLSRQETDVFYWDKFMTKPYVDSGQLRRIGEFLTPWPCFVIAATDKIIQEQPQSLIRLLRTLHDSCDTFMQTDDAPQMVSERYGLQLKDAQRWYHSTEWAIHGWVSNKMMKSVLFHLRSAGIIGEEKVPELIWKRK